MIKLIKNELKKIFSKKSFYIITLIFILFTILTNVIYKDMGDYSYSSEVSIDEVKEENKLLDPQNPDEVYIYINNLSEIQAYELKEKYSSSTQEYLIDTYYHDELYDYNQAKYIDKKNIKEKEAKLNNLLEKIEKEDWKYFVNLDLETIEKSPVYDQNAKIRNEYYISLKKYRLDNNINFDKDNFLNIALLDVEANLYEYLNLKNKDKLTSLEESSFKNLQEDMITNKYILEEKLDLNARDTLRGVLINFSAEFGLFILIYVILISSSMLSEEFNKGTIKYLLTKPYKRSSILTSKLLAMLILLPIILIMMLLIEFIVGGLVFGFNSLSIPMTIYESASASLKVMPLLNYVIKSLILILPMYLVILIFSFMISTITASTSAACTLSFMLYLVGGVISNIAITHSYKIFKLFVSLYWDFSYLVKGAANPYNVSTVLSLLVVFLYIGIMLCITYVYFSRKDVKNI